MRCAQCHGEVPTRPALRNLCWRPNGETHSVRLYQNDASKGRALRSTAEGPCLAWRSQSRLQRTVPGSQRRCRANATVSSRCTLMHHYQLHHATRLAWRSSSYRWRALVLASLGNGDGHRLVRQADESNGRQQCPARRPLCLCSCSMTEKHATSMHWQAFLTTPGTRTIIFNINDFAEPQITASERECLHTHPCSGEMASACVTQGRQRGLAPFEAATKARAGLHDVCKTERCMARFLWSLDRGRQRSS